jgi:hypothetical protein
VKDKSLPKSKSGVLVQVAALPVMTGENGVVGVLPVTSRGRR